ncbi:MAG: phage tail tube protein [Isosphaeraceae bacterium]
MALNDKAVVTAAVGYVFTAPAGTKPPTPTELDSADPERFGCEVLKVKVNADATSYTLTVGASTTASLPIASTPEAVQAALAGLSTVGADNVTVDGLDITSTDGFKVTWVGTKAGQTIALTGTATGGVSPAVTVTTSQAANGWFNIGHTSREKMPDFGFSGGEYKLKGTWQRKRLKLVQDNAIPADFIKLELEQWDRESLSLYFGDDAANDTAGIFGVDGNFVPVERALLVIIVDGSYKVGFYAPKTAITRDGEIKLPLDDFAALPIKATFLNMGVRRLYDWISSALFPQSS